MTQATRKPDWIRVRLNMTEDFRFVDRLLKQKRLHTVCEEARCPNIHECWGRHRTATFMILGDVCTRRCRFCSVRTGLPGQVDVDEPQRVAESVAEMGLAHVVITMVNRDDLKDGGSAVMAETIRAIRRTNPLCRTEILSSDVMGNRDSIETMLDAGPDIMSHNIETVERLTPQIRSRSDYRRSLDFLRASFEINPEIVTKSSMMLGLGERVEEIERAMDDLREVRVSLLNMGQYLRPTPTNIPVQKYWTPDEFNGLKRTAMGKGFTHVESAPLVRSSYHAGEQLDQYLKGRSMGEGFNVPDTWSRSSACSRH